MLKNYIFNGEYVKHKILFIDRDGTLIDEPQDTFQIDDINKLIFKKHVISALRNLMFLKYKLIMVTNQDGLGSLSFPWQKFNLVHDFMLNIFRSESIIFDDILICPHVKNDNCLCRKPNIKMLEPWIQDSIIDRKRSYVIGDRITDMKMAENLKLTGIRYKDDVCDWIKIEKKIVSRNRYAEIIRTTKETKVHIKVYLDLNNSSKIHTGINFFDHMLEQIAVHSGICLNIFVQGDLQIDDHHTIEDTGIVLGKVLLKALGDKHGLCRYGFTLPMDESYASCIIDISNRPYLRFLANFRYKMIGDMNANMIEHFFYSLCYSMKITLHLHAKGKNDHHRAESLFKVFGRTLRQSIRLEGNVLPTSKGIL